MLHYRRVGKEQSAEIILNNGPHLIVRTAFGKQTEVNPGGFTILVKITSRSMWGILSTTDLMGRRLLGESERNCRISN